MVVAYDHRIEPIAWCVSADDELLAFVYLVFDPCAIALGRFVTGVFALGDDPFEAKLFDDWINSSGVASMFSDNEIAVVSV